MRRTGNAWSLPAIGIVIGQWAHALTDMNDSKGTMLFFPFTTHNFSLGTWAYAAQRRRDKRPLPQANVDAIRSALYTGAPSALTTAIKHGLVRLELCTTPDGGTEVQWVDA